MFIFNVLIKLIILCGNYSISFHLIIILLHAATNHIEFAKKQVIQFILNFRRIGFRLIFFFLEKRVYDTKFEAYMESIFQIN